MSSQFLSRTLHVNLDNGLHLRPYSLIAEAARRYPCEVRLRKGDQTADAKAVIELMTLNAGRGSELVLEAEGEGANDAVEEIVRLFEINFDEEVSASP